MKRVDVHITIGPHTFDFCVNGQISSSWKDLSDTAQLVFPRNIKSFWGGQEQLLQDLLKRGQEVEVQVGYDGNMNVEFVGFVTDVQMGMPPVVVECEDLMWSLKQSTVNESYKSVSLTQLIEDITWDNRYIDSTEVLEDVDLGPFRIENQSPASVLDYLKKSYGLKSFFRGKVLYVGFAYPHDEYKKISYDFQKNVKEEGNDLKYKNADDIKLKVEAISIMPDNSTEKVTLGDESGAVRTLHFYNLSKPQLERAATVEMEKLKYNGFRGKFDCWGDPVARHGDIADITDKWYPEHKGAYFIDKVITKFGTQDGYHREIHLGLKATSGELGGAL